MAVKSKFFLSLSKLKDERAWGSPAERLAYRLRENFPLPTNALALMKRFPHSFS